jgi:hypothetical protein
MARSFYHLSILVLVSILLRPSPLPSKLFCLLELTQPAEFGGEVMCTAVLWPYVCQRMSDFFLEQLRLENLVACKWKMLSVSNVKKNKSCPPIMPKQRERYLKSAFYNQLSKCCQVGMSHWLFDSNSVGNVKCQLYVSQ